MDEAKVANGGPAECSDMSISSGSDPSTSLLYEVDDRTDIKAPGDAGSTDILPVKNGLSESIIHDSGVGMSSLLVDSTSQHKYTPLEPNLGLGNLPSASDVKNLLASLVAQNARLRLGQEPLSNGVQSRIQGLLSDEICDRFAESLRGIERQAESLDLNGAIGSSIMGNEDRIPPKAPRAMLTSESVLEDAMCRQGRTMDLNGGEAHNPTPMPPVTGVVPIPIPLPALPDKGPKNSHSATSPIPPSTSAQGIAIPLDPRFFSASTSRSTNREEGEIRSTSIDSMRRTSNTSRSGSPEYSKHRLPPGWTYRSPEERKRRPRSPPRRGSPRAFSPDRRPYPRRSPPPDHRPHRRRSPSVESSSRRYDRRTLNQTVRRTTHELKSPRSHSRSLSPSRRRRSEYDVRPPKPSINEVIRAKTMPEVDIKNDGPAIPHQVVRGSDRARSETSSSDHRRSNHERGPASLETVKEQEPEAELSHGTPTQSMDIEPLHDKGDQGAWKPKATPSMSSSLNGNGTYLAQPEPQTPVQSSSRPEDVRMRTVSPVLVQGGNSSKSQPAKPPESIVTKPCHNVPGLWMIKEGLGGVQILTCVFEIDKPTADRWAIRGSSRHGKEKEQDLLSLRVACVPMAEMEAVQTRLDLSTALPHEVVHAVGQTETVWPPAGHLVIEINRDKDWGRSWLPRHLDEEQTAIEVIDHVHEGMNVIRFIQLADLSKHMFIVIARPKPPDFYCPPELELGEVISDMELEEEEEEDRQAEQQEKLHQLLLKDVVTSVAISYS